MFTGLFDEEAAVGRNKRQQLDHLLVIAAPHERVILVGIGLILLTFVIWAFFGSIARSVTIDGILIKPGVRHEIISAEPGHLTRFFVVPGDRVQVGDPIALQSVPELEREMTALSDQIKLLEAGIGQAGREGEGIDSLLDSARIALLQKKAERSARELIVSHLEGEVMALMSDPGEYLQRGYPVAQLRDVEDQPVQVALQVDSHTAQRIRPGMSASVEVVMPDGMSHHMEGEVASMTPRSVPDWLATLLPATTEATHRIDVALHRASEISVPDSTLCRVRVMLGRYSLVELFGAERS